MYKSAIIGLGGMGTWHYQNITDKIDRLEVKGIFDIREEAVEKAKEKGLHIYNSVEEILADEEISLVTVATPNNFHKGLIIQCLQGGKNVISEKPVTMNAEELVEIIEVQKQTGKLFSVHQNRRWDKDFCIVKKILDDNLLGKPYFIESRVQGSRGALHNWRNVKENGGGMLLDWGVHLLDQLMIMIDSPVIEVDGHLMAQFSDEVDDNSKIMLRFQNNISAIIEVSTNCYVNNPRWHVSCNDGTAVVHDWDCNGAMLQKKIGTDMEWTEDIVYTAAGPTRTMAPRPKRTIVETPLPEVTTDWSDYYNNILDVLDGIAELQVKPEQALRVMRVIDLIFKADEQRCAIKCEI